MTPFAGSWRFAPGAHPGFVTLVNGLMTLIVPPGNSSICVGPVYKQPVPPIDPSASLFSDVLLGGITTGLILFLRDLVNAVRSSWEEVTRGKITDQLAASAGPAETTPTPQDAKEAAQQVAGAATDAADKIEATT